MSQRRGGKPSGALDSTIKKGFFPGLDAWFARTFPPKKLRRISMLLGALGAVIAYIYATAAGVAVGGWMLGGAVAGFLMPVLGLYAVKLLLLVLILAFIGLIFFALLSMMGG